jgi:hypothetical protein
MGLHVKGGAKASIMNMIVYEDILE